MRKLSRSPKAHTRRVAILKALPAMGSILSPRSDATHQDYRALAKGGLIVIDRVPGRRPRYRKTLGGALMLFGYAVEAAFGGGGNNESEGGDA